MTTIETRNTLPSIILDLPLIKPLLALLQSRKFVAALMTLAVDMLIAQAPQLEPVRNELLTVFTLIGLTVIGSIAHEDAAAKTTQNSGVTMNVEKTSGAINVSAPTAAASTAEAPPASSPVAVDVTTLTDEALQDLLMQARAESSRRQASEPPKLLGPVG
jgi:hypothetical protein